MSELKKGVTSWVRDPGEPVVEAYYTVVQKYTMGKEAKAVSRIINGFDESGLAKSGLNIDNQQLFIYRLFELNSGHVFCKPFLDKVAKK